MNLASRFYDTLRHGLLGPELSPSEVGGCNAILTAMAGAPLAWTAYALATAYKETAHTMQPIEEMGGVAYFNRRYGPEGLRPDIAAQLGNAHPGDGALFRGRGYVQLTGRGGYAKASAKLGVDLIAHPELALRDDIAAKIMRNGMSQGWFTGKGFGNYLPGAGPGSQATYEAARRIINGKDCCGEIAGYALGFERALVAGGWE
jgi:putative chitinase